MTAALRLALLLLLACLPVPTEAPDLGSSADVVATGEPTP